MLMPKWIELRTKSNSKELTLAFLNPLSGLVFVILIAFCFIYYFGAHLISYFNFNVALLDGNYLFLLMFVFLLQFIHSYCGFFLTINNDIPYAYSSVVVGILIFFVSWWSISLFGSLGGILSLLIIQLIYNNWKWPLEVVKFFRRINEES